VLDHDAEAETIRGFGGVKVAGDAADETDGSALLENLQVAPGGRP
jgi:hypothetical protein